MSQKELILNHLKTGRTLTAIEALNQFGCFRLASRIVDLKKDNHDIKTEMRLSVDGTKRFAEYSLGVV